MRPRRRDPGELAAAREAAARLAGRLADFGWPCSPGWVAEVLRRDAEGRADLLAAAVAELGSVDLFYRARAAGKSESYIRGAIRRAVADRLGAGRSRPARPTSAPHDPPGELAN